MASFALVTEGITDQALLSAILYGYCKDEPDITEAQPVRDETDIHRQGNPAGWERVLEFCTLPHFEQLFLANDFAIIQIDSDVGEEINFGVALTDNGQAKSEIALIEEIRQLLVTKISLPIYEKYRDRIIFAIAVHSLECWLLPAYAAKADRTINCEHHLGYAVRKSGLDYEKTHRTYEKLSKPFEKKKNLLAYKNQNVSLDAFLNSLPT